MSDTPRALSQTLLSECEENPAGFVSMYIDSQANICKANERIAELESLMSEIVAVMEINADGTLACMPVTKWLGDFIAAPAKEE